MSAHEDHTMKYGDKATKLVKSGYDAIQSAFDSAKNKRALFPKGEILPNKIHSQQWTVPPLLDVDEYRQFTELTGCVLPEDVLMAIGYILRNVCKEGRLRADLVIGESTHEPYARLTL